MAVQRDITALGLCDLQEIHPDAREADRLCGGSTLIRRRHLLQGIAIDSEQNGASHENAYQRTHDLILFPALEGRKRTVFLRAEGGNGWSPHETARSLTLGV